MNILSKRHVVHKEGVRVGPLIKLQKGTKGYRSKWANAEDVGPT